MREIKRLKCNNQCMVTNMSKGTRCSIEIKYENIDLTLKTKCLTSDGHLKKYDVMV